jgi:chromate transporter
MNDNYKIAHISFLSLIKAVFMIGITGYGGPALVGIIKNKFVEEKKWIEEKDFLEALSLSQILPGAISVTIIGNFGYKLKGFPGVVILPFFFLLPAFTFIIALSWEYFKFGNLQFLKTAFIGLGALVVALLVNAALSLGKSIFGKFSIKDIKSYLITAAIFLFGYFLKINVIYLILFSGLLGFLLYYFTNEFQDQQKIIEENNRNNPPFHKNPFYYFVVIALVLLVFAYFFYPVLWNLFYNFFKIGVFGFGGGYTIIPLIQKQVVEELGLVTFTEFRDGIAMGQITPGPVFITTTFIGFKVAGLAGAIVSTIASYSPSLIAVVTMSKILLRIKHKKIVQVIIKGILSGFIGLLLVVVIQFGISSLINWQTWLIFLVSIILIPVLKKDPLWGILTTILLTVILL